MAAQPTLDHIVVLVSHETLLTLPERLAPILTVTGGGRHADGLTWNHLILFQDGVYIELIAFFPTADPALRRSHRWGQLSEGTIIDWACSLPHEPDFGDIQKRVKDAGTKYRFTDPAPGGRITEDGTVLKWAIGAPVDAEGEGADPGLLPFWCLDRTPRRLRVPYEENKQATTHPCGAKGVSRLVLKVKEGQAADLKKVFAAINPPAEVKSEAVWHFDVPSGRQEGRHSVGLQLGNKFGIQLALVGGEKSPSFVELLPGVTVKLE